MKTILTNRDVAVLVDVYQFRYLSASQVEALHFPSQRTAYRRLQTLRDGKYLKAFTVQRVSGRIFHLDTYGAAVVAESMQVDIDDLQWNREMRAPKDYYFLRHFMAINDFRIALTLACQNTAISLLGFIPEYIGEKTDKGNVKKYLRDNVSDITDSLKQISHTPDAAFALEKDGNAAILLANPKPSHSRLIEAKHPFRFVILAPLPDKASKRQSARSAFELGGVHQTRPPGDRHSSPPQWRHAVNVSCLTPDNGCAASQRLSRPAKSSLPLRPGAHTGVGPRHSQTTLEPP